MQLTFKIVLDKRYQKQSGLFPLKLRVYELGAYKEMSLSIFLKCAEWCDKSQLVLKKCGLFREYNTKLSEIKARVQRLIIDTNSLPWVTTAEDIIKKLQPNNSNGKVSFFAYSNELIEKLIKSGRVGNANAYKCAVNKLKAYNETTSLYFEQITPKLLDDFKYRLIEEGIKINTIGIYLREVRAIYNKAINDGIVDAKYYPFNKVKIKKEVTINRTLTIEQLNRLFTYPLEINTPIWKWRCLFMLSFCLRGINMADLLTLKGNSINNGRIVYKRLKTGKIYSISVSGHIEEMLGNFVDSKEVDNQKLILPIIHNANNPVQLKKEIHQAIKTCNKYMNILAEKCAISTNITSYYARYSWANVAKSLGYSKDIIAEALGHEYGNRVTGIYLDNYSNEIINEVNESVINAVFKIQNISQ